MASVVKKLLPGAAGTAGSGGGDDDFNLVTQLYQFDGSNGAQNNTFLDSSSENHTVTATTYSTPVVQGTFSPFSADPGKWSMLFEENTTSDHLTLSDGVFAIGTGDFTAECFIFLTGNSQYSGGIFQANGGSGGSAPALAGRDTTGLTIYSSSGQKITGNNGTLQLGVWYHIALVRASSVIRVYVDGALVTWTDGTTAVADTTNITNSNFAIGKYYSNSYTMDGYISNFRVVTSAVYTSAFDKPTEPLTSISNTILLTCNNNMLYKSSGAYPSIGAGSPKIKPFSPFKNSAEYDPAVHGGSGFFPNGIGGDSYLSVSDATDFDFGTSNYTLEAWVYPTLDVTSIGNFNLPFAIEGGNNYWGWTTLGSSGYDGLTNHVDTLDSNSGSTAHNPPMFQWTHIVYQVTGGNNNWYWNGVRVRNATAATHASAATGFRVGRSPSYNNHRYGGFISDVRIIGAGYNAYSNASTLTVPTAPLTNVSYTKLLLNFTNAAMFDQSGKTNIETVGNAQLNTSIKKFGTASAKFDESGDYLVVRNLPHLYGGDFTIEGFVYFNSSPTDGQGLFVYDSAIMGNRAGYGPALGTYANNPQGKWHSYYGTQASPQTGTQGNSEATPSATTWIHFAYVRTSGVIKIFIGGNQIGSNISWTGNYTANDVLTIAGYYSTSYLLNGYIDSYRVTLKARYTSNFDVPTEAFSNI